MAKISLSGSEKSIEEILSWYYDQKEALRDFKNKILASLQIVPSVVDEKFITMTVEEINDYFISSVQELEHMVALDIISATEGNLRADFYIKVFNKDKSAIAREFRSLYKIKENKISLEEDIIENWKLFSSTKLYFSELLGLLKYRHWLAHGRYWNLTKKGRIYSVDEAYEIAENIFAQLI